MNTKSIVTATSILHGIDIRFTSALIPISKRTLIALTLAVVTSLTVSKSLYAGVLFQDNFNSGEPSSEWVSKGCCQWVDNGWYYTQDTNGWPRDSMAVVHDADHQWQDYKLSLKAQFVQSTIWNTFTLLLRTNNFVRSSAGTSGSAYQLSFNGKGGGDWIFNQILLDRIDCTSGTCSVVNLITKDVTLPLDPMNLEAAVRGAHIDLSLNGSLIFDVIDPNPLPYGGIGVHAIWEAEARFDDVVVSTLEGGPQLLSLGDINGDGAPEIAVVTYDTKLFKTTVTVRNAKTGTLVKQFTSNSQFAPFKANTINDLNGNGAPESAVLGVRDSAQAVQVEVRDSLSGAKIRIVPFPSTWTPRDLGIVRNVKGPGTAALAVLQQSPAALRVQLTDAKSGAQLRTIPFSNGYDGVDLVVLGDLNGNQTKDLAVLLDNTDPKGADKVEIRDSGNGQLIRSIGYGSGAKPKQLASVADVNGNGFAELAVLRDNTARVAVKDAQTGLAVNTLDYSLSQPYKLAGVPDAVRGVSDLALLGMRSGDGQIRADVQSILTDSLVGKAVYDNYGTTVDFISIPDINGNGVAELVRLREQPGPQKLFAEIRDGRTGKWLQGMYF